MELICENKSYFLDDKNEREIKEKMKAVHSPVSVVFIPETNEYMSIEDLWG